MQCKLTLLYRRDPAFLLALGRSGCPVTQGGLPERRVFFLHDPARIETLLTRHHAALSKGGAHSRAQRWLGASVLVAEGAEHARLRRSMRPAFQRDVLPAYTPAILSAISAQIADWRHGDVRDLTIELRRMATAAVLAACVGPVAPDAIAGIDAALAVLTPSFGARTWPWAPLAERLPGSAAFRQAAALRGLDAAVYALIDNTPPTATPFLAAVHAAEPPTQRRTATRDALVTLLLAGRETTAAALSWIWYALGTHPALEAELHAALEQGEPAAHALAGRIFAEALRRYPPAWATARRTLAPIDLDGVQLPAGAVVLFSQLALHNDARWFAAPEAFRPERWAGAPPPRGAYLPFGSGPRRCLGSRFAELESTLAISTIAQRWHLRPLNAAPVGLQGGPALLPQGGMPMRLERR